MVNAGPDQPGQPVIEGAQKPTLGEPAAMAAAVEIVEAARVQGGDARALGGVAVALRCPTARSPGPLARSYSDVDLATNRASLGAVVTVLGRLGYEAHERFNAVHGHARLLFDRNDGVHLDVFVENFAMCHRLPLAQRLTIHPTTVPLADLLLTKLQVARLNAKDVTDAAALLLDHEVSLDETGINGGYIAGLLGSDWGWWRTVTQNLSAVGEALDGCLGRDDAASARRRLAAVRDLIEKAPKGLRWKARARAGDRIRWREEPEETA